MNKVLRSILKTAVCVMDQYSDQVDRASNRVSDYVDRGVDRGKDLVDRGKEMIHGRRNHGLRNALSFAAGLSIGIGAGLLFAPASGREIRSSIREKVQDIRSQAV